MIVMREVFKRDKPLSNKSYAHILLAVIVHLLHRFNPFLTERPCGNRHKLGGGIKRYR